MPKLDRFKLQSARRLRASMTDEERLLWRHLWRIPVEGTHFRRQASVGAYYPDFISHRLKLIVEVDGSHRNADDQLRHDEVRTRWFESQVYRVVRLWNHEIKTNWIPCSIQFMRRWKNGNHTCICAMVPKVLAAERPPPRPGATRRPSPSRGGWELNYA
jgi:very-short-patch-repair endonuclease